MSGADTELMLRARKGDEEAFEKLVLRYQKPLVNFFYRLVWDRQKAEDFAQEVFIKIFLARKSYSYRAKFTTYLFRIARNLWIDYLRASGRRPKPLSLDGTGGGEDGEPLYGAITADSERPSDAEEERESLRIVKSAIDSLPEEQKLVFILSENQGLKYSEVAEVMAIPIGTVKSRMYAAMEALRRKLSTTGKGSI